METEILHCENTLSAVALGNFDGVHIGHRAIIGTARREALRIGGKTLAWTFCGRTKSSTSPMLTLPDRKCELLAAAGCDDVICADFYQYRDFSPERFVNEVLIDRFNCRAAVCGFNYRFGKNGAGDAALLSDLLGRKGGRAFVLPPVRAVLSGESAETDQSGTGGREVVVSSSLIRAALSEGRPLDAAIMLGRPYSVRLPVRHGRRLGRLLGFPTINQRFPDGMITPRHGVYVCFCTIDGAVYRGVSSIGVRPTVDNAGIVIMETHLFGYSGDLYGAEVEVGLIHFLRPELKFNTFLELRSAIARDAELASAYSPPLELMPVLDSIKWL